MPSLSKRGRPHQTRLTTQHFPIVLSCLLTIGSVRQFLVELALYVGCHARLFLGERREKQPSAQSKHSRSVSFSNLSSMQRVDRQHQENKNHTTWENARDTANFCKDAAVASNDVRTRWARLPRGHDVFLGATTESPKWIVKGWWWQKIFATGILMERV